MLSGSALLTMDLLIIMVVSGMFLKGLYAKDLVLSVALLKSSGSFKRQGLVGGLGSLELCTLRRLGDLGRPASFSFVHVSATR